MIALIAWALLRLDRGERAAPRVEQESAPAGRTR